MSQVSQCQKETYMKDQIVITFHRGRAFNRTHDRVGEITWGHTWERFLFVPVSTTMFDSEALREIADQLDKLDEPCASSGTEPPA